jgi:uncharacterized membrane protein
MARIEHSVEIKRPTEEVFSYLTEVPNLPEWQSGVLEVTSDGPLQKGAILTERRKLLGMKAESTLEVTEHKPNELFELRVVDGPVHLDVSHQLTPTEEGTRLHVIVDGDPGGFAKLAGPLILRTVRRELEFDLGTLKDVLEARNMHATSPGDASTAVQP